VTGRLRLSDVEILVIPKVPCGLIGTMGVRRIPMRASDCCVDRHISIDNASHIRLRQ